MTRILTCHLLFIGWATFVGIVLTLPGAAYSAPGGWIPEFLVPWIDKLVHGFLFFVFAILASRSLATLPCLGRPRAVALVFSLAYILVLESLQLVVPGRSWELMDLVAGGLGAWLGLVLFRREKLPALC